MRLLQEVTHRVFSIPPCWWDGCFFPHHYRARICLSYWECRRRFNEYIKTNRESWTEEEDQHLLKLYEVHGSRWTQIAKCLENNRSYELVKRRYGQLLYNLNKRTDTSLETGKISNETSNYVSSHTSRFDLRTSKIILRVSHLFSSSTEINLPPGLLCQWRC